jgi:hypothetical protein
MSEREFNAYRRPVFRPSGTETIGYHCTASDNLEAIAREGLKISKARGSTYSEPDMIWAYAKETEPRNKECSYIVFKVPKDKVEYVNAGVFVTAQDVPARDILAVHRYYSIPIPSMGIRAEGYLDTMSDTGHRLLRQKRPAILAALKAKGLLVRTR